MNFMSANANFFNCIHNLLLRLYFQKEHLKFCSFVVRLTNHTSSTLLHCLNRSTVRGWNTIHFSKMSNWLNKRTGKIIIKFNVYNPSLNLFSLAELTVEILPTNGIKSRANFVVTKLFAVGGTFDTFSVVSHVFVFLFFLVFTYCELKQLHRWKREYFKKFWNILQGILVLVILTCVIVFFLRLSLLEELLARLDEDNQQFLHFDSLVFVDSVLGNLIAFVVFLSWFRFIKFLQFNRRLSFLQDTLGKVAQPLATYSIVFLSVFFAYVHSGYLLFFRELETFHNLQSSFTTLCSLFMGDFNFSSLQNSNRILGPLFIFSALFFGGFIIINLLIALILESFLAVKMKNKANKYDLVQYIKKHLHYWFGSTEKNTPGRTDQRDSSPGKRIPRHLNPGKRTSRGITVLDKSFSKQEHNLLPQNSVMKTCISKQETSSARIERLDIDFMTSLKSVCAEDWREEVMFYRLFLKRLKLVYYDHLGYVNDIDVGNLEDLELSVLRNEMYHAVEKYSQELTDRVELPRSLVSNYEEQTFSTFDLKFEVSF